MAESLGLEVMWVLFPLVLLTTCTSAQGIISGLTRVSQNTTLPYNSSSLASGNAIDECWARDSACAARRQNLASCARGYGEQARGGLGGRIYQVTTTADDPENPPIGSLRYGVTRDEPLWIVFARDMVFQLKAELRVNSFKSIDGRGARISFANSPCLQLQGVTNVIVHGLNFTKCVRRKNKMRIRTSASNVDSFGESSGDAITVEGCSHVWIDHCFFDSTGYWEEDKHIVMKRGSRAITISNNKFVNMNKVILLSHDDTSVVDKNMTATVMLNFFGQNLEQRLPRCRFGSFHIVNNNYPFGWGMYAIGGSAAPTILSEGNFFVAGSGKSVTGRDLDDRDPATTTSWNWKSRGDMFMRGAFFEASGSTPALMPTYKYPVIPASRVPVATAKAGPLNCVVGRTCI